MLSRIINFLRKARGRKWVEGSTGTPVEETEDGKLFAIVHNQNTCPVCQHQGFYEGPHGGMSVNIYCANRRCRQGFWVTDFGGGQGLAKFIDVKGDIARYPEEPTVH